MDVITTHQLTKTYGGRTVVDALDLRVPEGCVYGFLGPNGSGKSTTLKMLLRLVHPTSGEAALFEALKAKRIGGAIIDTWYQYPGPQQTDILPSKLPFHELSNVLMTPHMSGWTSGTIRRRQQTMADNIKRCFAGSPLTNVVKEGRSEA